ncbi:MAG: hypothetical protein ACP5D7_22440 [Limnospira sp.]
MGSFRGAIERVNPLASIQLQRGQGYRYLKPPIALTLTDFEMFPGRDRLISRFIYKEKSEGWDYIDNDKVRSLWDQKKKNVKWLETYWIN